MHAAATSRLERVNAELERLHIEQVEAIAARDAAEVETLRAGSAADIGEIDAWAKAETDKTKAERLRRIDGRREQLARELEHQETIKAREIFAIEVAVDEHRKAIDLIFGRIEVETDPAAIAKVAAKLPPFPALAEVAEKARRGVEGEFANLEGPVPRAPAGADVDPDGNVSQSRLMAVMDPGASGRMEGESARPWETEPHAVAVTAEPPDEVAAADAEAMSADAELVAVTADPAATTDEPMAIAESVAEPTEPDPSAEPDRVASGPQPSHRVGSTLLRTIKAIRPVAARTDRDDEGWDPR
jgi:hypothetical protein